MCVVHTNTNSHSSTLNSYYINIYKYGTSTLRILFFNSTYLTHSHTISSISTFTTSQTDCVRQLNEKHTTTSIQKSHNLNKVFLFHFMYLIFFGEKYFLHILSPFIVFSVKNVERYKYVCKLNTKDVTIRKKKKLQGKEEKTQMKKKDWHIYCRVARASKQQNVKGKENNITKRFDNKMDRERM